MHARWWYRGEKEQNINKIKLFISKIIKMNNTRGFESIESLFSVNFTAWFTFFKNHKM